MREFLKQYRVHVLIGGFLVVFLPLSVFFVYKLRALIALDIATKQDLQIEQEVQQRSIINVAEITEQAAHIHENRDKMSILLEDSDDAKITLFADIEEIAENTGHSHISFSVEEYTKQAPARTTKGEEDAQVVSTFEVRPILNNFLYLRIETRGTFNNMIAFLQKIDNMPYLSDVLSFNITAAPQVARRETGGTNEENDTKDARTNLVNGEFFVAFYVKSDEKIVIDAALQEQIKTQGVGKTSGANNPDIDPQVAELEGEQYLPMQGDNQ